MNNLHKINNKFNLTDEELSVLAYCQLGIEGGWQFKVINGRLYSTKFSTDYGDWEPVLEHWYTTATMDIWRKNSKFKPDLSVILP